MPRSLLRAMKRRSRLVTDLDHDDRVVLFPTLGHLAPDGSEWIAAVHGDVFAAGKAGLGKRVLLKLLQRAMHVPQEAFASPLFQQRISRFMALDRPGKRIAVRIGDDIHPLARKTRRNGHFVSSVRIPAQSTGQFASNGAGLHCLAFEVCGANAPLASGHVYLLPDEGLSVISDIDDTLKHSFVSCKRTLLANTFLRPFEAIPGMAAVFRNWAAAGAAFHYVSSSPWQLYEHLAEHLAGEGFPAGSFHLRSFRLRDQLLRRVMLTRRSGKANVIRSILRTFAKRRFLLVGDSGELDPEIYGYMGRRFPAQVAGIYIRQLGGECDTPDRFAKAFRGLAPSLVRLYRVAEELIDVPMPA